MNPLNGWRIESRLANGAIRYWKSKTAKHMQIGKYRGADAFDKATKASYEWHGKWYVNVWYPEKTFLFETKEQAFAFAKKYMVTH